MVSECSGCDPVAENGSSKIRQQGRVLAREFAFSLCRDDSDAAQDFASVSRRDFVWMGKWDGDGDGSSTLARFGAARDCDVTAAASHELLCYPKANPGTEIPFSGVKGLKNPRKIFWANPISLILDDRLDAVSVRGDGFVESDG